MRGILEGFTAETRRAQRFNPAYRQAGAKTPGREEIPTINYYFERSEKSCISITPNQSLSFRTK
jgi:hypothetical protein